MAGALRKTMVYLGLAEEQESYEAYDVEDGELEPDAVDLREPSRREVRRDLDRDLDLRAEVAPKRSAAVTPITRGHLSRVSGGSRGELHRISTIHPRTYNEAKTIGETFREGTPVIMNLSDMTDADAKRLVDFAAGLAFGLHGAIERVTNKVFLLSPADVEVAPAEQARADDHMLFDHS
jgi:cell division inhibitor SepF